MRCGAQGHEIHAGASAGATSERVLHLDVQARFAKGKELAKTKMERQLHWPNEKIQHPAGLMRRSMLYRSNKGRKSDPTNKRQIRENDREERRKYK
jgi:hypothetical protein